MIYAILGFAAFAYIVDKCATLNERYELPLDVRIVEKTKVVEKPQVVRINEPFKLDAFGQEMTCAFQDFQIEMRIDDLTRIDAHLIVLDGDRSVVGYQA